VRKTDTVDFASSGDIGAQPLDTIFTCALYLFSQEESDVDVWSIK